MSGGRGGQASWASGRRSVSREGSGEERSYTIVGEDEADPEAGLVSWVSPLAKVLEGACVGAQRRLATSGGADRAVIVDRSSRYGKLD